MNDQQKELVKTARVAGIWYLLMAISGIVGFLMLHSKVYNADPQQTLSNITEGELLARTRLLLEFAIVITQALTAVWFYKLFKDVNRISAWTTGIWGTVNAVVIMFSAIAMGVAIKLAFADHAIDDKILLIDLLSKLISGAWSVGGLFFGLWLLPLGYVIISSRRMPVALGWTLILGGAGYLLSTCLAFGGVSGSWISRLTLPATIGEFWMIGYLLIFGIRPESN